MTQYLISHTFPTLYEHLYIASEQCYIWRLNTVIYGVWTLLYIASEHCYIWRLNTAIYCVWTLIYCISTLLYIASEHCYIFVLNTVIYSVWTLLYIVSEHCDIMCVNTLYIASQKTEKTNHFQNKYIFYAQDHICFIWNFYCNYATRKL